MKQVFFCGLIWITSPKHLGQKDMFNSNWIHLLIVKLIGHLEQLVTIYDQQETMWNKSLFSKILQFIVPVRLFFECYDGLYSHPFALSLSSSVYWATYHSYGDHFLSRTLSTSSSFPRLITLPAALLGILQYPIMPFCNLWHHFVSTSTCMFDFPIPLFVSLSQSVFHCFVSI